MTQDGTVRTGIPTDCPRLAEVDFPIAEVSRHAAKEKSIRYGHPSTMHLWWARRPLAACRAILLALLLPDPCHPLCPSDFKAASWRVLERLGIRGKSDADLRQGLLKFIGAFADWDLSAEKPYLDAGRALVAAAYPDEPPLVVDPFAGGGSIPLEAMRLGCEAFASELNPVAGLILRVMLEEIPRHGPELADELRQVGKQVKEGAERELAGFYPADSDGGTPIAYLWARTVRCEAPSCGTEIPLAHSFWLSKKGNRRRALRYRVERPKNGPPTVVFEVSTPKNDRDVQAATVTRAKVPCPACHTVLPPERVRAQLSAQRGGADVVFDDTGRRVGGARLLAVVVLRRGEQGRHYRLPTERDYAAVRAAAERLETLASKPLPGGLSPVPDEPLPLMSGTFNAPLYGMTHWGDLFSARQKLAMLNLQSLLVDSRPEPPPVRLLAALALSRFADISNALCLWENTKTQVRHLFNRQAIPMLWDFAEASPFGDQAGDYSVSLETIARVVEALPRRAGPPAQVRLGDARDIGLPDESASVWFTDPPYYFAVPYADLSDFFYVWLKRTLPEFPLMRDTSGADGLTPKDAELVEMAHWDLKRYARKDQHFFEEGMREAFAEGRRLLRDDGIGCVVFAHKTTEGWEALLSGMIGGGWVITGSWPIATEAATRPRARNSAALATSVHLVCRPRTADAPVGDWRDVLSELPRRVAEWMEHLQGEGVRGADLVFACMGPALEVYSRYSSVVDAEEREIPLGGDPEAVEPHKRGFLAYVWEVVGRAALEQVLGTAEARARNGGAGALEEDARLSALFLWTLQTTNGADAAANAAQTMEAEDNEAEEGEDEEGAPRKKKTGFTLVYDVVRRIAQPLGIHLPDWEDRIIETEKGVVRLLPVVERAKQLLGEDGAAGLAERLKRDPASTRQLEMFGVEHGGDRNSVRISSASGRAATVRQRRDATTLDRVHIAMLLQRGGQTNGLRTLLTAEQERGSEFVRLANALSALYPRASEEKRLVDAMLLAMPR